MKRTLLALTALTIFSVPALVQAQTTVVPPPGAPVAGTPATGPGQRERHEHERHPEMRKALRQLQNAKETLQHAAHDYSGHRDQAIRLIEQAEAQIQQGLESDRH